MYASPEDLRAEFGEAVLVQLTDAPEWGEVAIARINVKIAAASAEIDGYIAKYYQAAPGIAVPPLLVIIAVDLAYARLYRVLTDDAKERQSEARRQLRDISKGLLKIDQGNPDALPAREGQIIVPDAERTFSRDRLRGF